MDAERLVPWDDHVARGVSPGCRLFEVGTERCGVAGMTGHCVGSGAQIPLCEQVGVDVVVRDRAVFVGAGDAVDTEAPLRVVMTERAPEPGGLDQQFEADVELEGLVAGHSLIADNGVANVAGEVEGRRAGRPVARAFVAANRPPRKYGAGEAELGCALAREVECGVAPAQGVSGRVWSGVREHGQDESLAVPERVPVIAGTGQALRGDRTLLGARTRLERVKEREAQGLLKLRVSVELDVSTPPELVEVGALPGHKSLPAGVSRFCKRGHDLVAESRV